MARQRKDARPAELLDAALAVFIEHGFAAARMDEIAARAGVAKGTLYLYFSGKDALFEALVRQAIIPRLELAEAMAAGYDGPVAPLLCRLVGLLRGFFQDERLVHFPRLIIGDIGRFPELARFYKREVVDRALRLMAALHRRGVERGEFRPQDSDAVARLVAAPVLMMAIWRTVFAPLDDTPFDPGPVLDAHVEVLLRGLAAAPGKEDAP